MQLVNSNQQQMSNQLSSRAVVTSTSLHFKQIEKRILHAVHTVAEGVHYKIAATARMYQEVHNRSV